MTGAISSSAATVAGGAERPATVRVWDPLVRLFHWSLVASFAIAWLSEDAKALHQGAGYVVLALVAVRLIWGLVGSRHARFRDFVPRPQDLLAYLKSLPSGHARRYLGHNPAGGAMILLLIVSLAALCLTGWMQTLDAFWGEDWVEELHEALANLLLVLVGLHLAGVALASLKHQENLVRAMVTGRKRAPASGDEA